MITNMGWNQDNNDYCHSCLTQGVLVLEFSAMQTIIGVCQPCMERLVELLAVELIRTSSKMTTLNELRTSAGRGDSDD